MAPARHEGPPSLKLMQKAVGHLHAQWSTSSRSCRLRKPFIRIVSERWREIVTLAFQNAALTKYAISKTLSFIRGTDSAAGCRPRDCSCSAEDRDITFEIYADTTKRMNQTPILEESNCSCAEKFRREVRRGHMTSRINSGTQQTNIAQTVSANTSP